jgi:hypothetical protein
MSGVVGVALFGGMRISDIEVRGSGSGAAGLSSCIRNVLGRQRLGRLWSFAHMLGDVHQSPRVVLLWFVRHGDLRDKTR